MSFALDYIGRILKGGLEHAVPHREANHQRHSGKYSGIYPPADCSLPQELLHPAVHCKISGNECQYGRYHEHYPVLPCKYGDDVLKVCSVNLAYGNLTPALLTGQSDDREEVVYNLGLLYLEAPKSAQGLRFLLSDIHDCSAALKTAPSTVVGWWLLILHLLVRKNYLKKLSLKGEQELF